MWAFYSSSFVDNLIYVSSIRVFSMCFSNKGKNVFYFYDLIRFFRRFENILSKSTSFTKRGFKKSKSPK